MSNEHALVEYALTGTLCEAQTFYASDEDRFSRVNDLASAVSPELVAKTAVYCRHHGRTSDGAAFLVAWLAQRDVGLMLRVFPRVIDDARMLRAFVAIVRSGVTGRKSFGSAPKRALRDWFAARSPDTIFRQSIGQSPSMSDVIKMVRPPPRNDKGEADAVREALYGYLIGKNVDDSKLPALVQAFEAWKRSDREPLPDVPLEMLATLHHRLAASHWTELAKRMTFTELRKNLVTLFRFGVFADDAMVSFVAESLSNEAAIRTSRVLPYQLLTSNSGMPAGIPAPIRRALACSVDLAVGNVPAVRGTVAICPDVSGSMHAPIDGRERSSTNVRCIDIAALATTALLRRSERAIVLPFSSDVVRLPSPLSVDDSVATHASLLASLSGGGTSCAAPLRWLNMREEAPDLLVVVSDHQSWSDFHDRSGTGAFMEEWARLRARNPRAKLVLVDLQPRAASPLPLPDDVLFIGGFSDAVFDVVASFARNDLGREAVATAIEAISI